MNLSAQSLALLKSLEGLRLRAYRCSAGVPSIGYGRTEGVAMGDTCTVEQAEAWLAETVASTEAAVLRLAQGVPLTQPQFDALVLFTYNVGVKGLGESTLLQRLRARPPRFAEAAEQFLRWDKVLDPVTHKHRRDEGLATRRSRERALFLSPSPPALRSA